MSTSLCLGYAGAAHEREVRGEQAVRVQTARVSGDEPASSDDLATKKDRQCVERTLRGDTAAYQELVERYERRAFAVALSVLGNPEDAKDVAQDAFLRVYQKLDTFKGESAFYTWLYRIVFNLAVDLSRKRYRTREIGFASKPQDRDGPQLDSISHSEHSAALATPIEASLRSELGSKIDAALSELSPEHRAVIVLREFDGLSYSEIADSVGISKGTVMSRLHHARKRLQKALAEFAPIRKVAAEPDEAFEPESSLTTRSKNDGR